MGFPLACVSDVMCTLAMILASQCVLPAGRSIRHAKDYACIVLIDERYETADIQKRLPTWIVEKSPVISNAPYGKSYAAIAGMYVRVCVCVYVCVCVCV